MKNNIKTLCKYELERHNTDLRIRKLKYNRYTHNFSVNDAIIDEFLFDYFKYIKKESTFTDNEITSDFNDKIVKLKLINQLLNEFSYIYLNSNNEIVAFISMDIKKDSMNILSLFTIDKYKDRYYTYNTHLLNYAENSAYAFKLPLFTKCYENDLELISYYKKYGFK